MTYFPNQRILNQPKAGIAHECDKFGVKFIICVSGAPSEFHRRTEVGKHVDLMGWVVGGMVDPRAETLRGDNNSTSTLTDFTALISCF